MTDPTYHDVLNHGFIALIDVMGNDDSPAEAARVSYQQGTKQVRDNSSLVRFLMRHKHYSPFASATAKFHVRLPLFVRDQWVRHDRFSFSMASYRYSQVPDYRWRPEGDNTWRSQSKENKQCSEGELGNAEACDIILNASYKAQQSDYENLINAGAPREQARALTSVGAYTDMYVTASLGDWMLFLSQRLHSHAQYEIRVYAEIVLQELKVLFPNCMQAFEDYQLNARTFSSYEMEMTRSLISDMLLELEPEERRKLLSRYIPTQRERIEYFQKVTKS